MKRLKQVFTIAVTAYTLYRVVSDFLETETGNSVKEKVSEYTSPIIDKMEDYYASAQEVKAKLAKKAEQEME